MAKYNRLKHAAKRIKDRNIHWEERYTPKSFKLKERLDQDIGPKSYIRYEGHDVTTNSDYYVVLGPSVQDNQKKFFAGIRKLPKNPEAKVYSPYGEYFPTMHAAQSYASKRWGVAFDKNVPDYKQEHIEHVEIPEHIKGNVIDHDFKYG